MHRGVRVANGANASCVVFGRFLTKTSTMGNLLDIFDSGAPDATRFEVCRRLPNISISATSTPEQISEAIQRLETRCVRLEKLRIDAEALTALDDGAEDTEDDGESVAASKQRALVNELVASKKSLNDDIVCFYLSAVFLGEVFLRLVRF